MRSFKPTSLLASLTAGLLVLALVVGAFGRNVTVVSYEHSHDISQHEEDDHHHDFEHEQPSEKSHDTHSPCDDSHHHHLTVNISAAACVPDTCLRIFTFSFPENLRITLEPSAIDEPFFELLKPPQIG